MLFSKNYIDHNSILFYVHIPKSGGTSVRENLIPYFNDNQVLRLTESGVNHYIESQIYSSYKPKNENKIKKSLKKIKNSLNKLFKKNDTSIFRDLNSMTTQEKEELRFISSNQERMTTPHILGKHFLKIMTIRDPLTRIQSYYFEAKSKKKNKPYQKIASKYDINDFINYLYDKEPLMVNDPYCVCLSGTRNFLITKKIIDNEFFLAAPVEKIDEFLNLLSIKLFSKKNNFKKFRVSNTNPKEIIINSELIDRIVSTNKSDIDLMKHIELEFQNILNNYKN
jgi:hypothetical protein